MHPLVRALGTPGVRLLDGRSAPRDPAVETDASFLHGGSAGHGVDASSSASSIGASRGGSGNDGGSRSGGNGSGGSGGSVNGK